MFIINKDIVPWKKEVETDQILNKMLAFIATENNKVAAEFRYIHRFILKV